MRDAVKKEALRKAGVECLEISGTYPAGDTRIAVRAALRRLIDRDAASNAKSNAAVLPAPTR